MDDSLVLEARRWADERLFPEALTPMRPSVELGFAAHFVPDERVVALAPYVPPPRSASRARRCSCSCSAAAPRSSTR